MDNAPGWLPDPEDELQERYWSGSEWTDRVRPAGPARPARLPEHVPELQRALAAATADIDAVEDRLSNLFERTTPRPGTGTGEGGAGAPAPPTRAPAPPPPPPPPSDAADRGDGDPFARLDAEAESDDAAAMDEVEVDEEFVEPFGEEEDETFTELNAALAAEEPEDAAEPEDAGEPEEADEPEKGRRRPFRRS